MVILQLHKHKHSNPAQQLRQQLLTPATAYASNCDHQQ
jgi:hypothetical protein